MKARFIAQSFKVGTEESAGLELSASLAGGEFSSLFILSAFASSSGVAAVRVAAEATSLTAIRLIIGIDQHGTSKEALEALLVWQTENPAAQVWVFYQPEAVIYHPKLYLLEGAEKVHLLVGSSNLTSNGLFRNLEAGTLLSLRPLDTDDAEWLMAFRLQLAGFYDTADPNLQPLYADLITDLMAAGLVPDEATVRQQYAKSKPAKTAVTPTVKAMFPKRKVAARPSSKRKATGKTSIATAASVVEDFQLVWERIGLPASSVQQAGSGTNPTGGFRLVQAGFTVAGQPIDQTSYFRQELFGHLEWHEASHKPFVEITTVVFRVLLLGKDLGNIPLSIRHKPSGEAGQHNYTTLISWGSLGKTIQDANLVGRTARMLRSASVPSLFRFELI